MNKEVNSPLKWFSGEIVTPEAKTQLDFNGGEATTVQRLILTCTR